MPVNIKITAGTVADCTQAIELITGIAAENLIADKAFDTDAIIEYAKSNNITVVIPPKSNRKIQREYDKYLYKLRHLAENAIMWLKQWRGISTRYTKTTKSFIAAVHIRCIFLWARILA